MNPLTIEAIKNKINDLNNNLKMLVFVCFNGHDLTKHGFARFELMLYLKEHLKNHLL